MATPGNLTTDIATVSAGKHSKMDGKVASTQSHSQEDNPGLSKSNEQPLDVDESLEEGELVEDPQQQGQKTGESISNSQPPRARGVTKHRKRYTDQAILDLAKQLHPRDVAVAIGYSQSYTQRLIKEAAARVAQSEGRDAKEFREEIAAAWKQNAALQTPASTRGTTNRILDAPASTIGTTAITLTDRDKLILDVVSKDSIRNVQKQLRITLKMMGRELDRVVSKVARIENRTEQGVRNDLRESRERAQAAREQASGLTEASTRKQDSAHEQLSVAQPSSKTGCVRKRDFWSVVLNDVDIEPKGSRKTVGTDASLHEERANPAVTEQGSITEPSGITWEWTGRSWTGSSKDFFHGHPLSKGQIFALEPMLSRFHATRRFRHPTRKTRDERAPFLMGVVTAGGCLGDVVERFKGQYDLLANISDSAV